MKFRNVFLSASALTAILLMLSCNSNNKLPSHPRILLLRGEEAEISRTISSDQVWEGIHKSILEDCDGLMEKPPVERVQIGRRLLDKSREALRRIYYLSYAWRITGDDRYAERAEKEMLAVSAFSDWNPSHFLDVAEMTMGVSIGYDWLYDELSPESRKIISNAIIEKGLKPSLDTNYTWWLSSSNNWNQVCNAGMTFGALAVYEEDPELASVLIKRADSSIMLPMEDYQPDGAYPEGYSYWGYGTSFNIMYQSAIEKAFGREYDPQTFSGFFRTAGYLENMTGPSGNCFNYSDCGAGGYLQPAMFWFAGKLNDPSLLWSEKKNLSDMASDDRLLPSILIWGTGMTTDKITEPSKKIWTGQGNNPVALLRSSWSDPYGVYVGFKSGSPSVNHGHMDIGSFVMEADGERWATDLGPQDYNSLETAGVDLWNMRQNSQRWEVFRYNNYVHNTLTVNGNLQDVNGYADISSWSDQPGMINAVADITPAYKEYIDKVIRGIAIVDDRYVLIRDEIKTPESAKAVIRWNLVTAAEVSITGNNTAELVKNGKKLMLKVNEPVNVTLKTWSTEPTHDYDAPNPGTIMLGFEIAVPSNSEVVLSVVMLPEGVSENEAVSAVSISGWPESRNE